MGTAGVYISFKILRWEGLGWVADGENNEKEKEKIASKTG